MSTMMMTTEHDQFDKAVKDGQFGDIEGCMQSVERLADQLLPVEGAGSDELTAIGANFALRRLMYGMLELRSAQALSFDQPADDLTAADAAAAWTGARLQDCRNLLTQVASRTRRNPRVALTRLAKAGAFGEITEEAFQDELYQRERDVTDMWAVMWEGRYDLDKLTLYFNAVRELHRKRGWGNALRGLVVDADSALRTVCTSENAIATAHARVIMTIDRLQGSASDELPAHTVDWELLVDRYLERAAKPQPLRDDEIPDGPYDATPDWDADTAEAFERAGAVNHDYMR